METGPAACILYWIQTWNEASPIEALAIQEVGGRLDDMKLTHYHGKEYYYRWIDERVQVAYVHGIDSPEWNASVEEWTPKPARFDNAPVLHTMMQRKQ